jgi:serine/threonine protein kinase
MDFEDWTTAGALGDRYVLRARVGSGRTATVYAADDVRLQRRVAVKLFHGLPDEDGLTRFAAEARTLAGLSHPGLLTVYDVCLDPYRPYLVMRLVVGSPLAQRLHRGGLEPGAVALLGAGLAEVLAYVHERGVVHGDIEAGNVIVDPQGGGYLTGFGIDRGLGKPSGDVYQLGMTLAECLPFDLGPEWRAVLSAMTNRDPDARPDATRSAELLRNVAAGETAALGMPVVELPPPDPYPPEPPTVRVTPATKRIRPAYAGVAGLGLAATLLAVVVAATTGSPGQSIGEQGPRHTQIGTPTSAAPATPTRQQQQPAGNAQPAATATHAHPAPRPQTYNASDDSGPGKDPRPGKEKGPAHPPKGPKPDKG